MSAEKVKENLFSGIELVVLESLLESYNNRKPITSSSATGLSIANLLSEDTKKKPSQAKLAALKNNQQAQALNQNTAQANTPSSPITPQNNPITEKPLSAFNSAPAPEKQEKAADNSALIAGAIDVSELATTTGVRDNDEVLRALYTLEGKSLARPHPEGDFTSTSWKITQTGIKALSLMKQNLVTRRPRPKKISLTGH